ncbi:TolC family protein [Siccirubricoccus deserti]
MRGWIALLGLALLAPAALAQAQAPVAAPIGTAALPTGRGAQPLTLAEAEALLVERNLGLIAARRGLDATRAQRLVASALPPPQVSVGSSFGQFNETARGALQGARLLSPSSNINVGLSVLVERGGKRELRTRVADQQIGQAEAQVLDALRTQLFQLRQAFLGALLARANLEVALANRASLDRTEALLRRQLRDGAIPEGDLLRFQASRLQFESDVTGNAQAYAAGIATVAALLAADPAAFAPGAGQIGGPGLVAPGLRGTAAPRQGSAAVPTTVQTILSPVAFDLRGRLDQMPVLGIGREALAEGVASRADVVAAQRQASAADANRQLAEAERSRDVTVNGSWGRSRLSQDLPNSRDQLDAVNSFGLSLSVPIFTRRIVEEISASPPRRPARRRRWRVPRCCRPGPVAAAWAGYEQARALLNLYTSGALGRAEDAYRSAEQAYVAGGRSLLEVLDALRTLNATRIQANQARHAYLLALATLEQASGVSGVAPRL